MNVHKLLLHGEMPVNCYVVESKGECYIIDPGYQKEKIQNYIASHSMVPKGILLTHAHIDHIEALDCFQVPVFIHERDVEVLFDDSLNGFGFFNKQKAYDLTELEICAIQESTKLELGEETIKVVHTPGHTVGSACFKVKDELFTGDTLFEMAVGKWDRPTANFRDLQRSVLRLINDHADTTRIHPGHNGSSTIGNERLYNPFYLGWKK